MLLLEKCHQNSQAVLAALKGYEASLSLTDVTEELKVLQEIKHSMTRLPASHWLRSDTGPQNSTDSCPTHKIIACNEKCVGIS